MGAIQQMLIGAAGAGSGTTVLWSATNKGASVVLSAGDSRMSKAGGGWESALGTIGHSSGLRQYELILHSDGIFTLLGAVNEDFASYTDFVGNSSNTSGCGALGYHCQNSANWYEHLESNASTSGAHGASLTTGDVLTVGVDFTGDTIKFHKNGSLVLTRSGFASLGSKLWYPAASSQQSNSIELRGSGLAFPIVGYTDWNA